MKIITSRNIGAIRRFFCMPFPCRWNAWVRDITARWERN